MTTILPQDLLPDLVLSRWLVSRPGLTSSTPCPETHWWVLCSSHAGYALQPWLVCVSVGGAGNQQPSSARPCGWVYRLGHERSSSVPSPATGSQPFFAFKCGSWLVEVSRSHCSPVTFSLSSPSSRAFPAPPPRAIHSPVPKPRPPAVVPWQPGALTASPGPMRAHALAGPLSAGLPVSAPHIPFKIKSNRQLC